MSDVNLTVEELEDQTREALSDWFRNKIKATMDPQYHHLLDGPEFESINFGGEFMIHIVPESNVAVKFMISHHLGSILDQIAGAVPILVNAVEKRTIQ